MRNFPINLLRTAQTVIGKQTYQLRKYNSRTTNAAGYRVSGFDAPIDMSGSVQRVKITQYKANDLDFSKIYIRIFDINLIEALDRETNADQIIWDGYLWHVMPESNWIQQGGWNSVLAVRLEKYTV